MVFALLLGAVSPRASWDPPGWRAPPPKEEARPTNPAAPPLLWAVRLYRSLLSPVDGDRCPSYPTCSTYALEAVSNHGPFLGFALTAGRLVSEADEAAFAPRIFVGGRWKVYSPVENDLLFLRGGLAP